MGWRRGTPRKDMGPVEVLWDGDGVPPCVWTIKQTETITFPHPLDSGGTNLGLNPGLERGSRLKKLDIGLDDEETWLYGFLQWPSF